VSLLGAGEIRSLLEQHGLAARRSLGQNFVADPALVERIAALAEVGPDRPALEIGPGLGSLTLALAARGGRVLAVELDDGLAALLPETLERHLGDSAEHVTVRRGDALRLDWPTVLDEQGDGPGGDTWTVVANLPYNVAVPVIIRLLSSAPQVGRLVVMVQHEVADRLAARPGGRTIGVPTIKVGWYASVRVLTTVPPEVFIPRPRVQSAVVSIDRRDPPSHRVEPAAVFELVDRAYGQRRKMLRSTLGALVSTEAFAAAGIEPTTRPEQLDVADWARLAEAVAAVGADPTS
jgi:16S rRNA (adenine1518-N6/adenine1519-N6)-dimethyltransferase